MMSPANSCESLVAGEPAAAPSSSSADVAAAAAAAPTADNAKRLFAAGFYDEACAIFTALLDDVQLGDDSADVIHLLCNRSACLLKLDRAVDATRDARFAVELVLSAENGGARHPSSAKAFYRLGCALRADGRPREALNALASAPLGNVQLEKLREACSAEVHAHTEVVEGGTRVTSRRAPPPPRPPPPPPPPPPPSLARRLLRAGGGLLRWLVSPLVSLLRAARLTAPIAPPPPPPSAAAAPPPPPSMITSLDELPSDVFDEAILSRLRLTTLLAVKCVSREWAAAARRVLARRDRLVPGTYAFTATRLQPSPGQIFNSDVQRVESHGVLTLRLITASEIQPSLRDHPLEGRVEEGDGERFRCFGSWNPAGNLFPGVSSKPDRPTPNARVLWPLERRQIVASAMALERADVTAARQTWRWKPILGAKATFLAGSVQGAEVIPLESMEWTLILEADG